MLHGTSAGASLQASCEEVLNLIHIDQLILADMIFLMLCFHRWSGRMAKPTTSLCTLPRICLYPIHWESGRFSGQFVFCEFTPDSTLCWTHLSVLARELA